MEKLWRIELFGGLRVQRLSHEPESFRAQKVGLLLAYLALRMGRPHPREVLVEALWPECDPDTGRHRLRESLSVLRKKLEPSGTPGAVLIADRDSIQLNPDSVITDVADFETHLKAARVSDPER